MKLSVFLLLIVVLQVNAQENLFVNPIIPGGYPDPSICRVNDEYFIVNSSFEYFPGLPIHKSKDLVNWELIGYGLHRKGQCNKAVNLVDVQSDGGIHAPSIRFHKGLFYIITTNVYYNEKEKKTDFVNFIITANNPGGPWSDPHVLEGAPGIDPDIFFDDDGKVWYVGTHSPQNPNFPGEGEIWLQEIDLNNWKLKGKRTYLWRGACGGVWAEGPHIYKRNGSYYLMIAEGGTSYNHAMMIAVSNHIEGPFIPNDRNPIFTSRHLSYNNWVHSTGHADLIQLEDSSWYMVALGIRGDEQRGSNMGRETHLLPVQWEKEPFEWKEVRYEWPVCAPKTGKLERSYPVPFQNTKQNRNDAFSDNFDHAKLNLEWNFRRLPLNNTYDLISRKGFLRLFAKPDAFRARGQYSLMGFRQKESDFEFTTKMEFMSENQNVEAGISLFQKDDNYFVFDIIQKKGAYFIQLKIAEPGKNVIIIKEALLENYIGQILFKLISKEHKYQFLFSLDNGQSFTLHTSTSANHILSKGYTGAYLGFYASGNDNKTKNFADFDWVWYKGFPKLK